MKLNNLLSGNNIRLLPVFIALVALVMIGNPSIWVTLTVAGLAMGMMIFLMASGLSLIFGLMDVMNFSHSAFVAFGAFIAASVLGRLSGWNESDSVLLNMLALFSALGAAMVFGMIAGLFFEKVIIKPVYQDHLRQILITVGALIVSEQLILVIWGGVPINVARPHFLQSSLIIGDISIEVYRIFAVFLGTAAFIVLHLTLNRTRIGLLVRAGVENREMVEALGFKVEQLFIGVFVVGSGLAALGGAMWAGYETLITPEIGAHMMISIFVVVIIGGLGSIEGSLLGALIVGLVGNYMAFLFPKMALATNMLVMIIILMWRPYGLRPMVKS